MVNGKEVKCDNIFRIELVVDSGYLAFIYRVEELNLKIGAQLISIRIGLTSDDLFRQVMTRGQIHTYGEVKNGGYINIFLGFKTSPSFKVLVYYVNAHGETIADSKAFDVAECFQNQVSSCLGDIHIFRPNINSRHGFQ